MQDQEKREDQETENARAEEDDSGLTFAEQEFFTWCDSNRIDHEEDAMDEDDAKNFRKIKRHFTDAVDDKRLIIDGKDIVYTISDMSPKRMAGKQFTIRRPNGRALLAMDGYKDTQQMTKLNAFMAAICGIEKRDIGDIAGLDNLDHQFIQDIAVLFLTA
jgi:hypothetical protein